MCDYEQMNQIAAYGGFPQRYPHWRFGAEYERLRKQHHYGLGRIYEMVINNDPCYAYLQESNALVDQKLVIAHVYGHCDFFKNNLWFSQTNRKMMDEMANHATRVRRHIEKHGQDPVERWLDICMSVELLIDPQQHVPEARPRRRGGTTRSATDRAKFKRRITRPMDQPARKAGSRGKKLRDDGAKMRSRHAGAPDARCAAYCSTRAPGRLAGDCLSIIREEDLLLRAAGSMSKVYERGLGLILARMLMTRHFVEGQEVIDYADHHSGTVHMPPGGFNPYKIGIELFRDIEDRWNKGKFGKEYEEADTSARRNAGTRAWASAARRSSKCGASTTT
jgi:stage V sporulation protein R